MSATPVTAAPSTWQWPLNGSPRILRRFAPPPEPWLTGHRGVDLAATVAAPVLAAGQGTIGYAGSVGGRGVVTVDHPGGLRTTYLPVAAAVRSGDAVSPGDRLGIVEPGSPTVLSPACTGDFAGPRLTWIPYCCWGAPASASCRTGTQCRPRPSPQPHRPPPPRPLLALTAPWTITHVAAVISRVTLPPRSRSRVSTKRSGLHTNPSPPPSQCGTAPPPLSQHSAISRRAPPRPPCSPPSASRHSWPC